MNHCHVFTKIKKKSLDLHESAFIKKLHKHPRVSVIRPEKECNILSNFLFADVVILQGYGTSYIETLLVNPHIAACFVNAEVTFDTEKYPLMPIIRTTAEIIPSIQNFINCPKKWTNKSIRAQINRIMIDQFGGVVENVTSVIINDIVSHFDTTI
jgi:hypothetical protein